ncbi:MAG: GNAT family N-acetyltransferase [Parvularculaceae bacterium]
MADGGDGLRARLAASAAEIPAATWNALAVPRGRDRRRYNPFIDHAFLHALEQSGSVNAAAGWRPCHLLLEDAGGALVGAAPMYLKGHSQGEYVFDFAWADAYERAGGRYYPKLQIAVPFTPATGPRLLTGGDGAARKSLARAAIQIAARLGVSSLHITFAPKSDIDALCAAGALPRTDSQFHWKNEGYGSFEDFLAALASRKRKAIRKERAAALAQVEIDWLTGSEITESHWDAFWDFYQDTGARKWGYPYLTRSFFSLIGEAMADRILLVFARRNGAPVAGALNFIGGDALYGRYWGCTEHIPFLHFELCYYQAIEFAIARGLARVEAGAQGEHKLARGYVPVATCSAHWIADPGFRGAIENYLAQEGAQAAAERDFLAEFAPFRKG